MLETFRTWYGGKLGIQSEPSPAVIDILPLRSPGSLCSLTYVAFHSESTTMSLFSTSVAGGHTVHSRNAALKCLHSTTNTYVISHFNQLVKMPSTSSALKNPECINMQVFFPFKSLVETRCLLSYCMRVLAGVDLQGGMGWQHSFMVPVSPNLNKYRLKYSLNCSQQLTLWIHGDIILSTTFFYNYFKIIGHVKCMRLIY